MSPPDTNVKKQTRRHKGSLGGIALAIVLTIVAVAALIIFASPKETVDAQDSEEISEETTTATE